MVLQKPKHCNMLFIIKLEFMALLPEPDTPIGTSS